MFFLILGLWDLAFADPGLMALGLRTLLAASTVWILEFLIQSYKMAVSCIVAPTTKILTIRYLEVQGNNAWYLIFQPIRIF